MIIKVLYWTLSVASLGLLAVDGPTGSVLTTAPERGKVTKAQGAKGPTTLRTRVPYFIWLGGGYQGGK